MTRDYADHTDAQSAGKVALTNVGARQKGRPIVGLLC